MSATGVASPTPTSRPPHSRFAPVGAQRVDRRTLRAHAKLTLTLRVTGVRDDGFHLIDAEMVSLDLHDVLTVDPTGDAMTISGPFAAGLEATESNLVVRSLRHMGAAAHVHLDKHIPHGGGLGGGSSDAAAVLRWAGMGTAPADLAAAAGLGADIAFCLVGGHARVRGIGEVVEPLPHEELDVTLVIPPLTVSTPAVYREWDRLGAPTADGPNDLEPAALVVEPALAAWRDRIAERIGRPPTLAGSGATWFVVGRHQDALADLVDEGARLVVARTVPVEVATNLEP